MDMFLIIFRKRRQRRPLRYQSMRPIQKMLSRVLGVKVKRKNQKKISKRKNSSPVQIATKRIWKLAQTTWPLNYYKNCQMIKEDLRIFFRQIIGKESSVHLIVILILILKKPKSQQKKENLNKKQKSSLRFFLNSSCLFSKKLFCVFLLL